MEPVFSTPQEALAFYGRVINHHRFDELLPVLAKDVLFWFSSGSFAGLDQARGAFERTWARIVDENYWLEDVDWLALDTAAAACSYAFNWHGRIDGKTARGSGRGTTVLRLEGGSWKIVHEHLSAHPHVPGN